MGAPETDAAVAPIIKVSGDAVLTFPFQAAEMHMKSSVHWWQRSAPQARSSAVRLIRLSDRSTGVA